MDVEFIILSRIMPSFMLFIHFQDSGQAWTHDKREITLTETIDFLPG
jgi:hypothetical protein